MSQSLMLTVVLYSASWQTDRPHEDDGRKSRKKLEANFFQKSAACHEDLGEKRPQLSKYSVQKCTRFTTSCATVYDRDLVEEPARLITSSSSQLRANAEAGGTYRNQCKMPRLKSCLQHTHLTKLNRTAVYEVQYASLAAASFSTVHSTRTDRN